ncbi:hypothetical protein HHK36_002921 [Tetracentron sinense]|uniref:HTH La-type RNA-binding domain-containing protein n=1 Tax=Tetracentron sinense TaxID=13715 RepID=A0A834ZXD5_TETSI|nr:hypothetical protein HHK36_002921 [Tetracentron sinense]
MATASDFATHNHSLGSSGFSGDGLNSPQFHRRNLSPPWANLVKDEPQAVSSSPSTSPAISSPDQAPYSDSSPVNASSPSSDNHAMEVQPKSSHNCNGSVAEAKTPVWNKPLNSVVEVGPVMGAVSWPALSESTRSSAKSSSDSLKVLSDGSVSVSLGTAITHSPQTPDTNNANPNSSPKNAFPARQKSMRRGGGRGRPANGGFTQPPLPRPPVVEMPQNNSGNLGQTGPDSSPRDPPRKSINLESGPRGGFVSQSHLGNDHPQQRNSFSRGSGRPHPRGDGHYHNSIGSRRNWDGGNYEWNPHPNFNGRDFHVQQQRVVPRNYIRPPPPSSTHFISPTPMRSFGYPMGYPDMTSSMYYLPGLPPESPRGVPFFTHALPPAMFFPAMDLQLRTSLVNQIDFYFSDGNLIRDTFLRENMDEQGWVPITLIAGFNKVKSMTNNIQLIMDAVRTSTVVEVQGDKVRKRDKWMDWILPPNQFPAVLGRHSPGRLSYDMQATFMLSVSLEENISNHNTMRGHTDMNSVAVLSRLSSGELSSQSESSSEI